MIVIGQIQAVLSSGEIQASVAEEADVWIEQSLLMPIPHIDGLARVDCELPARPTRSTPLSRSWRTHRSILLVLTEIFWEIRQALGHKIGILSAKTIV